MVEQECPCMRTERIYVRLTPSEKDVLAYKANRRNKSISDYVRDLIVKDRVRKSKDE